MFLKSLAITSGDGKVIRDIKFHNGLNLIVDETPVVSGKETGNNVGKTTVLKLIDFCFGSFLRFLFENATVVWCCLDQSRNPREKDIASRIHHRG